MDQLWRIANHLLPKNWEVDIEPAMGKPSDAAIADAIIRKYPKCTSNLSSVEKWRSKHKKCDYCIYGEDYPDCINAGNYIYCAAKRKNSHRNRPRPFCSLFQIKKEKQAK